MLDLWVISFHAVVVFGLGKNILFKSILGCCVQWPQGADELLGDAHLNFCVIAMALDQEKKIKECACSFIFFSLTEITANIAKIHSSSSTNSYWKTCNKKSGLFFYFFSFVKTFSLVSWSLGQTNKIYKSSCIGQIFIHACVCY